MDGNIKKNHGFKKRRNYVRSKELDCIENEKRKYLITYNGPDVLPKSVSFIEFLFKFINNVSSSLPFRRNEKCQLAVLMCLYKKNSTPTLKRKKKRKVKKKRKNVFNHILK